MDTIVIPSPVFFSFVTLARFVTRPLRHVRANVQNHVNYSRFGTKGLSISFVSTESDAKKLEEVQSRFEVDIPELPDQIETSTYMQAAT